MMDKILPYHENIYIKKGTFIQPDGRFISFDMLHEEFFKLYCLGNDYSSLFHLYQENPSLYQKKLMNYCRILNKDPSLGYFITSSLSKDQISIYEAWDRLYPSNHIEFMIQVMGWDKVESLSYRNITTSSMNPHIRFFNYYLMDWDITQLERFYYDENDDKFYKQEIHEFSLQNKNDILYEEKILDIKNKVKSLELRKKYFMK